MTEPTVTHATFCLERTYPAPPSRVFAAWAEPAQKARWFALPGTQHELDFRIGGHEYVRASVNGAPVAFESTYRDIVDARRIVYSSVLSMSGRLATLSITTVELTPTPDTGTRLVLTEQDTFLDRLEQPAWREQGTADQLSALDSIFNV